MNNERGPLPLDCFTACARKKEKGGDSVGTYTTRRNPTSTGGRRTFKQSIETSATESLSDGSLVYNEERKPSKRRGKGPPARRRRNASRNKNDNMGTLPEE